MSTVTHRSAAWTAARALWRREVVKFVRDRSRLIGALAQPLAFWVLLGLGFGGSFQMPGTGAEGVGYLEYLFPGIIALILLFTAIFSTISVVEERQSGFLQAPLVAPVPRPALTLGIISGGTTLAVVQALLFVVLWPLVGPGLSVVGVLLSAAVSLLLALAFTSLGFVIAWRMDSTRGFHAVMNLFLLPLWFLSGSFFPAEGASAALRWTILLNPVTYAVSALRQALYWPMEAPAAAAPLSVSLFVSAAFAVLLVGFAVWTVRRPLFASK